MSWGDQGLGSPMPNVWEGWAWDWGPSTVRSKASWVMVTCGPLWIEILTDTHNWKHYLPATSLTGGNNFRRNSQRLRMPGWGIFKMNISTRSSLWVLHVRYLKHFSQNGRCFSSIEKQNRSIAATHLMPNKRLCIHIPGRIVGNMAGRA